MARKIETMKFNEGPAGNQAWVGAYIWANKAEVEKLDAIAEFFNIGDRNRLITHLVMKYMTNGDIESRSALKLTHFEADAARATASTVKLDAKDKRFVTVADVQIGVKAVEPKAEPIAAPAAPAAPVTEPTPAAQIAALTSGRRK